MDFAEALRLHIGAGLFATNAAGAEHHDRLVFQRLGKFSHGSRKIPKVVDARRNRTTKGAKLDFVVVARVEQCDPPALVEPLFKGASGDLGRGAHPGPNAFHSECDDLFFDPHEHPRKWLVRAFAKFRGEAGEPRDRTQFLDQSLDRSGGSRHKQIDPLGAQKDRSPQPSLIAKSQQSQAQRLEVRQLREAIGGDVGDRRWSGLWSGFQRFAGWTEIHGLTA